MSTDQEGEKEGGSEVENPPVGRGIRPVEKDGSHTKSELVQTSGPGPYPVRQDPCECKERHRSFESSDSDSPSVTSGPQRHTSADRGSRRRRDPTLLVCRYGCLSSSGYQRRRTKRRRECWEGLRKEGRYSPRGPPSSCPCP